MKRTHGEGESRSGKKAKEESPSWDCHLNSLAPEDWESISKLTPELEALRYDRDREPHAAAVRRLWPSEAEQCDHIGRWVHEVLRARSLRTASCFGDGSNHIPKRVALVVSRFIPEARQVDTKFSVLAVSALAKLRPEVSALCRTVKALLNIVPSQVEVLKRQARLAHAIRVRRFFVLSRMWFRIQEGKPYTLGVRVLTTTAGPFADATVVELPPQRLGERAAQLYLWRAGDPLGTVDNRQIAWMCCRGGHPTRLTNQDPEFNAMLDALEVDWTAANFFKLMLTKAGLPFALAPDLVPNIVSFLVITERPLVRREVPQCPNNIRLPDDVHLGPDHRCSSSVCNVPTEYPIGVALS